MPSNPPSNPFEHHHAHPPADAGDLGPLDPAQQSLADALRVSFVALKAAMLLIVLAFLASGLFKVNEQQRALKSRFGRIVGEPGRQVLEPGGPYFAWPYPIEQVVRIPTSPQQLNLNTSFWYESEPGSLGQTRAQRRGRAGPLNPEKDGSLLTGDANLIHARWSVTYMVREDRCVDYVTHVKDAQAAQRLVKAAVEGGVVRAAAQWPADDLMQAQHMEEAKRYAQHALDAVHSGMEITTLSLREADYPLDVGAVVQAVLDAESEKAKLIEEAQQQSNQILGRAAGEAYEPLLALIQQYELAVDHPKQDGAAPRLLSQIDHAFAQRAIDHGGESVPIGGEVATLLNEARTYRTSIVTRVRSEAQYFNSLLPEYRKNPSIVMNRLWEDAREQIFLGDVETIYLPRGQTYLELNRDPKVRQERQRQRFSVQEQDSTDQR